MAHLQDLPKYKTLESILATKKYYRASSGVIKHLICKETKKKVVTAPTETEFLENVEKFFR